MMDPRISDLIAILRLRRAMRSLQTLLRQRIHPESDMTPHEFEDRAMGIDHEEVNEALATVEDYVTRENDRSEQHPIVH